METNSLLDRLERLAKAIRKNGIRQTARQSGLSPMVVSRLAVRCAKPRTSEVIDIRYVYRVAHVLEHRFFGV